MTNMFNQRLKALAEKVSNAQKHMEELQGYMYESPASTPESSSGHTDFNFSKELSKDDGGQGEQK